MLKLNQRENAGDKFNIAVQQPQTDASSADSKKAELCEHENFLWPAFNQIAFANGLSVASENNVIPSAVTF